MTTRKLPDHGTISRYKYHKCRCLTCMDAWRGYQAHVSRQKAYGRWHPMVDAEPVRAHVQALMQSGIGIRRIAELADVSQAALSRLLYSKAGKPPTQQMYRANAEKILAIQPALDVYADGAAIDATGTRRRLQALLAMGWPRAAIGRQMGMAATYVSYLMRHPRVTARIARQVADVYDRLWDADPATYGVTEQAILRARNEAERHGWAPPLAWEDEQIDDPKAVPDTGTGPKVPRWQALGEDAHELVIRGGLSWEDAAARLGVTPVNLQRAYHRWRARAATADAAGEVA